MTDVITPSAWSRIEVSSGRRRRWSPADKAKIIAESFERGVTASDVARRHDISPQQLFQWRRKARSGSLTTEDLFGFAEVRVGAGIESFGSSAREAGLDLFVGGARIGVKPWSDLDLLKRVVRTLGDAHEQPWR